MMKQWPQDGRPVAVNDIVEPLAAAFAHCYHYTPKQDAGAFEYRGYNFGAVETAAGLTPQKLLKNPQDPLEAILLAGVGLGIEQGRRYLRFRTFLSDFNEKAKPSSFAPGAWPEDPRGMVSFEDATKPLFDALHHFYKLKRVRHSVDVDYKGYDTAESLEGASARGPDELLAADFLRYQQQEHDRPAYEIILGLAFQIGIEQGERLVRHEPAYLAQAKRMAEEDARRNKLLAEWDAIGPATREEREGMAKSVIEAIARKRAQQGKLPKKGPSAR